MGILALDNHCAGKHKQRGNAEEWQGKQIAVCNNLPQHVGKLHNKEQHHKHKNNDVDDVGEACMREGEEMSVEYRSVEDDKRKEGCCVAVVQHNEKEKGYGMPLYNVVKGACTGLVKQFCELKINASNKEHE